MASFTVVSKCTENLIRLISISSVREKDLLLFITLSARAFLKGVIIIPRRERQLKKRPQAKNSISHLTWKLGSWLLEMSSACKQHQKGKRAVSAKESVNMVKGEHWTFPRRLCVKEFAGRLCLMVRWLCPRPSPPDRCAVFIYQRRIKAVFSFPHWTSVVLPSVGFC